MRKFVMALATVAAIAGSVANRFSASRSRWIARWSAHRNCPPQHHRSRPYVERPKLLLVWRWLEWCRLVSVWLCHTSRLWLGRTYGLARMGPWVWERHHMMGKYMGGDTIWVAAGNPKRWATISPSGSMCLSIRRCRA